MRRGGGNPTTKAHPAPMQRPRGRVRARVTELVEPVLL